MSNDRLTRLATGASALLFAFGAYAVIARLPLADRLDEVRQPPLWLGLPWLLASAAILVLSFAQTMLRSDPEQQHGLSRLAIVSPALLLVLPVVAASTHGGVPPQLAVIAATLLPPAVGLLTMRSDIRSSVVATVLWLVVAGLALFASVDWPVVALGAACFVAGLGALWRLRAQRGQ